MKFEDLTVVRFEIVLFWVVTPCNLVSGYKRFGRAEVVTTYKTAWCHNPEDHNLKSYFVSDSLKFFQQPFSLYFSFSFLGSLY
jgi:hypothetical protein